jgi:hypothetical protein
VTALRAQALETRSPAQLAGLETQLEQSLTRLFALQETYPELKASENFSQLQRDLVEVEKQLQCATSTTAFSAFLACCWRARLDSVMPSFSPPMRLRVLCRRSR